MTTKNQYACHDPSVWNKRQKSHLINQSVYLQSIIYPSEKKKKLLEQAAFWHEVKVVCCLPDSFFTQNVSLPFLIDHILINSKWVNSPRNCRAYNSVELDSDHRIVSIHLLTSLRSNKKTTCKRPKFNWKKLQNPATKNEFQLELFAKDFALKWPVSFDLLWV